jgi:lipopolysaccharide export system protein LptA
MRSGFRRLWAFLLLATALAPAIPTAPEPERNAPLIMENADRFEGYRSRGEYVLSGKVRFRHGELRLETERAVWQKDRNIVFCESGMRITRNGALLTADRGTYDKSLGQATAQGQVYMRDSSGEVAATGQSIVYMRFRHLATLTGEPEVRRFYAKKDSSRKDSAKTAAAADSGRPDTLSIKGDVMVYNDSARMAVADGHVRIDRDKMHITCRKAEYHEAADSLFLLGDPQVIVDDNQVKGEIMRLGMHGEEIKSLLVKGKAQAHSIEPATDTSVARQSDVKGDSLFLAFKEKAIDSVQVFKNANGAYFDVDKPDYVNKMSGDYMVLRFAGKQVASANVMGGSAGAAKSTYYHFERKLLKGKNDAEGDTIDFAFKNGRVDEVLVKGTAKGTYYGEKPKVQSRAPASKDSASAPTTSAPAVPEPAAHAPPSPVPAIKPSSTAVRDSVHAAPRLPAGAPAHAPIGPAHGYPEPIRSDIPRKAK